MENLNENSSPFFKVQNRNVIVSNDLEGLGINFAIKTGIYQVKWRSIQDYKKAGIDLTLYLEGQSLKQLQIIEPGAGLSEFIPYVAEKTDRKPIVIDPLDYKVVIKALDLTRRKKLSQKDEQTVVELLRRAKIYTNSELVTLYQMTLEEALATHLQELQGKGDLIIAVALPIAPLTIEGIRKKLMPLMKNPQSTIFVG